MEPTLIGWSRAQFAMTAAYHWLFVPLTLGLAVIMAVMETLYVTKKDEFWKKCAKFWMKIFAINFAVGIATGLILEFEFGTNWSNYSWFVGDIFGAPLAVEGILAFFMEATFFAVMYFGWNKVSKGFHLASTWLVGIGATLSAFWILVANAWMQNPVGTAFNPDTVRSEMTSFWAVAGNPVAISKFFHSVLSGWMTGGVVAAAIACWYLLKKREVRFAKASIAIATFVGIIGGVGTILAGDSAGVHVAKYQPMKLAAAEGLEDGGSRAAFSIVPGIEVPGMLSLLATHDIDGYVPGINDIIAGYTANDGTQEPSVDEKMFRGKLAIKALAGYRKADNPEKKEALLTVFRANEKYLGYGYLNSPEEIVPNVPLIFWSFRFMIGLGALIMLVFILLQFFWYKDRIEKQKWLLVLAIICVPLVYLTGQFGWIVAEAGRQPWAIQGLLPRSVAVSSLSPGAVQTTFFIFLGVFLLFLIIELRIMFKAIGKGPEIDEISKQ